MFWNNKNNPKIFSGWPKTKCDVEKREVKICASYLSPEGAKSRDSLSGLISIATIIWGFMYAERHYFGWPHAIGILTLLAINHELVLPFFLNSRVWIVFTEDHIRVRTLFSLWKEYERGPNSYGFKHMPHKEGQNEPVVIGKNVKSYYQDSHQIYMNHYQGFLLLPGIYGWEKSIQLYNRIMGVEGWVNNIMPRIWGSRPEYDYDVTPKERGIIMTVLKKLVYLLFVVVAFSLIFIAFAMVTGLAKEALGPEMTENFNQFFFSLHPLIPFLILFGLFNLGIKKAIKIANDWNDKVFGTEDEIVVTVIEESTDTSSPNQKLWRGCINLVSWPISAFLLFVICAVLFNVFGIGREEVDQLTATVPKNLEPLAGLVIGSSLVLSVKFLAKLFADWAIKALGLQKTSLELMNL